MIRPVSDPIIYFDNAATTWPKPPGVVAAVTDYMTNVGGSPGRSGHRLALEAGRIVLEVRENLARLFNVADPGRIALTKNATEALNVAILGLDKPRKRVITTGAEHNSVMRPLRWLEATGQLRLEVIPCRRDGVLDLDALRASLRQPADLVVATHASNVTGVVNPLSEIGTLARQAGAAFLVDAAQTAGAYPIDVEAMGIDLLAFTGHKSLFGPTGTGGLYVHERLTLSPLMRGGTGSRSEAEAQPGFMPDQLESGTLNCAGLAGLRAGTAFILGEGIDRIAGHDRELTAALIEGLLAIDGVRLYGPPTPDGRISLVSFNLRGMSPSEVGLMLDEAYGVMCRVGLHCAPAAHRALGTFPEGTVRFSLSYLNTHSQIEAVLDAVAQLAKRQVYVG